MGQVLGGSGDKDNQMNQDDHSRPLFTQIHNIQNLRAISCDHEIGPWALCKEQKNAVLSAASALNIPAELLAVIFSYFEIGDYLLFCHGGINKYFEGRSCDSFQLLIQRLKVGLFGATGAGKSDIVSRFLRRNGQQSVRDNVRTWTRHLPQKEIMVHGVGRININILDHPASRFEEFPSLKHVWFQDRDIIVLCFAIHAKDGLDHCLNDIRKCRGAHGLHAGLNDTGVVLVGCQMDRMYDSQSQDDRRVMEENYNRAKSLSIQWNIPFIETSARNGVNVHSLFEQIVYEYWLQLHTDSVP